MNTEPQFTTLQHNDKLTKFRWLGSDCREHMVKVGDASNPQEGSIVANLTLIEQPNQAAFYLIFAPPVQTRLIPDFFPNKDPNEVFHLINSPHPASLTIEHRNHHLYFVIPGRRQQLQENFVNAYHLNTPRILSERLIKLSNNGTDAIGKYVGRKYSDRNGNVFIMPGFCVAETDLSTTRLYFVLYANGTMELLNEKRFSLEVHFQHEYEAIFNEHAFKLSNPALDGAFLVQTADVVRQQETDRRRDARYRYLSQGGGGLGVAPDSADRCAAQRELTRAHAVAARGGSLTALQEDNFTLDGLRRLSVRSRAY